MSVLIERLKRPDDVRQCAQMMVTSAPWTVLGVPVEGAIRTLSDSAREVYATRDDEGIAGFVVIDMRGLVAGYVQVLCVRADKRGQGLGTLLLEWAQERIFRDSPNAFICVSSFNPRARRLYERLGFRLVGPLHDFIIRGADELLLRKSREPWMEFHSNRARATAARPAERNEVFRSS